jgi:uncharacterized OsmC-like protein
MYTTVIDNSPKIRVSSSRHVADYAVDGSLMNPLEAFYASLAACAAVYAKKACKNLGLDAAGIEIACKPFAGTGGPLTLGRYRTEVHFPAAFAAEQKAAVLEAIGQCAVKEVVKAGAGIDFIVVEA